MLLIDPAEAALAIGAKCNGSSPDSSDPFYVNVIDYITSRVEAILNVGSLTSGYHVDRFDLPPMPAVGYNRTQKVRLRLCNGFLVQDSWSIALADETPVDETDAGAVMDLKDGVLTLTKWRGGAYLVSYVSGFDPAEATAEEQAEEGYDPEKRVLQNIPAWMKALVIHYLVLWFRTTLVNPKVPDGVSYRALVDSLRREVQAWSYGSYLRPRADCVFGAPQS